jgi:hypothetical protein
VQAEIARQEARLKMEKENLEKEKSVLMGRASSQDNQDGMCYNNSRLFMSFYSCFALFYHQMECVINANDKHIFLVSA